MKTVVSDHKALTVAALVEHLQTLPPEAVLLSGPYSGNRATLLDLDDLHESFGVHLDNNGRARTEDTTQVFNQEIYWYGWDDAPEWSDPPEGFHKVPAIIWRF